MDVIDIDTSRSAQLDSPPLATDAPPPSLSPPERGEGAPEGRVRGSPGDVEAIEAPTIDRPTEIPLGPLPQPSPPPTDAPTDTPVDALPPNLDTDLPSLPAPLPDRLAVAVHDPLGDWSVDLFRHDGALDLLFRGDTGLATAVRAAEGDIRAALADAGQSLGLLEYARQDTPNPNSHADTAGASGERRHTPRDPHAERSAQPPGHEAASPTRAVTATKASGRRVDRVA